MIVSEGPNLAYMENGSSVSWKGTTSFKGDSKEEIMESSK